MKNLTIPTTNAYKILEIYDTKHHVYSYYGKSKDDGAKPITQHVVDNCFSRQLSDEEIIAYNPWCFKTDAAIDSIEEMASIVSGCANNYVANHRELNFEDEDD